MTHRPLIGLTCSASQSGSILLRPNYFEAIYAAGGMPIALARTTDPSALADYAVEMDGFFFTGGVDVDPVLYHEEISADNVEIDHDRDAFELGLFEKIAPMQKPILGVCRGIQLLNVARGGTLYQDIPGHHQSEPGKVLTQHVHVSTGSKLKSIVGVSDMTVNSFHHQAVKAVAPGLIASAMADDGTVEAIEDVTYPFFVGVQWHPEYFWREEAPAAALFRAFVESCNHS